MHVCARVWFIAVCGCMYACVRTSVVYYCLWVCVCVCAHVCGLLLFVGVCMRVCARVWFISDDRSLLLGHWLQKLLHDHF